MRRNLRAKKANPAQVFVALEIQKPLTTKKTGTPSHPNFTTL